MFDAIVPELAKIVIGALGTVLVGLLVPILLKQLQRLGLQVSAEQDARLRTYARAAIRQSEEIAGAALKATGAKIPGSDKLDVAVENLLAKVPGITTDEAARLVHEELPTVFGAGATAAAGFLQSVQTAATTGPTQ